MRGRGLPGNAPHPRKGEYFQLRAAGVRHRDAVAWVGVNERTARDWDQGIRHTGNSRVYPDGTRIDYNTGITTVVAAPALSALEAELHPRFLTLTERERMGLLHG